ncbi:MAG: bifunctional [glutamate--ammonia ligase]-adenylyl-L-tyrosine phosphorylase/[glutamate--ammonia-ligase] adenylyltransferase, partial [Mariprofundaceae bacterium]|nr:bifunctional [glutamate--ammonia ligase]-adenylyl-L-tyrosine phosphorylase/[glutamate--ammonia-ligase] adenylyltransferase [Mariprofundaceae bacterium]
MKWICTIQFDIFSSFVDAAPAELRGDIDRLIDASPLFRSLLRDAGIEDCPALFRSETDALLPDGGDTWVPVCGSNDLTECMRHLRLCKQRGLRHVIWWEIGLGAAMDRSWQSLADFAAGLMQQALDMARLLIAPRYGQLENGRFCIIGLGKLGGRELNLGSDVDPLFIWDGEGETAGGRQSVTAAEYFGHLARMLIRLMSERTEHGIVWPVDMRLRPGGDGAAICLSLDATLDFYQNYGQTWERAMLIKARPVAGDLQLGEVFITSVALFIYRRYLDYTSVAALAEMKRRIDTKAGTCGIVPGFDVKRGKGGIREIEFVIQSLQLLNAGRNPELRIQSSMQALAKLAEADIVSDGEEAVLGSAYRFWRRIEHAIQARMGEQTHRLPDDFAEYLPKVTGIHDIEKKMISHASAVAGAFAEHVMPVDENVVYEQGWLDGTCAEPLEVLDEASRARVRLALEKIDAHLLRGLLPERSRHEIEVILSVAMPRWLADANGVTAVEALAELIHAIAGRATWIDLLATHQGSLDWLIGALSASRYLAGHIVRDPSWLEWPLAMERGDSDVQHVCSKLGAMQAFDDVEQTLANIGRLTDRVRLLCALAIDAHTADPLVVGAWMADVADAATDAVLRLCRNQMHLPDDFPLVALAMGKHGSREMGMVSDLDMVFVLVHESPDDMLDGRSIWEHAQRLGRRMIQYLVAKPPFGAGFEFDARLRPSGSSGILVTNLIGFRDYQLHKAQTWEHQALCRARAVAGTEGACAAVDEVICEVLNQPWDIGVLA